MPGETPEKAADRIAGIGRAELLVGWESTEHDTSSCTKGQTDHDEASTIAFCLANGYGSPKFREMTETDERQRAARFDCLQRLRA